MEKHKAIPEGYMTVGQMAKKMDVTVRTLQHYDREGLLSPSAISDGGRRLYTDKDIIKLHQILSLKHLGFSLDDIKNRLVSLDTPQEVADALAEQAQAVQRKMESLSRSLRELELLREEVLQMQTVNFKKYADIIVNLQMENDFYWLIKHFDDQTLDHIRSKFDRERLIPSMTVFGVSMSALIGLPPSLVEIYGSDIKKVYRANGVPVYLGLVLTNLSAFLHLLLMSVILFFRRASRLCRGTSRTSGGIFWGPCRIYCGVAECGQHCGVGGEGSGKNLYDFHSYFPSLHFAVRDYVPRRYASGGAGDGRKTVSGLLGISADGGRYVAF